MIKRSECTCLCHVSGSEVTHFVACCEDDSPTPETPTSSESGSVAGYVPTSEELGQLSYEDDVGLNIDSEWMNNTEIFEEVKRFLKSKGFEIRKTEGT